MKRFVITSLPKIPGKITSFINVVEAETATEAEENFRKKYSETRWFFSVIPAKRKRNGRKLGEYIFY